MSGDLYTNHVSKSQRTMSNSQASTMSQASNFVDNDEISFLECFKISTINVVKPYQILLVSCDLFNVISLIII